MPNFKYKAISQAGANVSGVVEAYDEFEAIDIIKQTCSVVSSIQQVDRNELKILDMNVGSQHVKEDRLALMCSQFSIVLKAGMPIVRSVELIAAQTHDKTLKNILEKVSEAVSTGRSLASSFEKEGGKMLPSSFVETVRAGEESGSLEMSFLRLYSYYDKSFKIKKRARNATIQPIFLIIMSIVVVGVVMGVAMPVFRDLFDTAGVPLPGLTRLLMSISDFFASNWLAVIIVISAVLLLFRLWVRTEKGGLRFAKIKIAIPVLGDIVLMKGSSQLANTMSTILTSGLTIVNALTICSRVLDNRYLSDRLAGAVRGLEEGKPLGRCLKECDCFPDLLVEMTSVGDETGSLEETLHTIGEYFDSIETFHI